MVEVKDEKNDGLVIQYQYQYQVESWQGTTRFIKIPGNKCEVGSLDIVPIRISAFGDPIADIHLQLSLHLRSFFSNSSTFSSSSSATINMCGGGVDLGELTQR